VSGRPFTEALLSIDPRRHQTGRFELSIYQRCLNSSRKQVAEQEWLDQFTVMDIFKRWAKKGGAAQGRLLMRVLGVDEIALKKHHR